MAQALQHDPTALISELPTTGTANISTGTASSGSERTNAVVSIPLVQNIRQVRPVHYVRVIRGPAGSLRRNTSSCCNRSPFGIHSPRSYWNTVASSHPNSSASLFRVSRNSRRLAAMRSPRVLGAGLGSLPEKGDQTTPGGRVWPGMAFLPVCIRLEGDTQLPGHIILAEAQLVPPLLQVPPSVFGSRGYGSGFDPTRRTWSHGKKATRR